MKKIFASGGNGFTDAELPSRSTLAWYGYVRKNVASRGKWIVKFNY